MILSSYKKSFDSDQELAAGHWEMIVRCSSYSVVSQPNWKNYTLGFLKHKENIIMGTKQFVLVEILLSFGYDAPNHP